MRLSIVQTLGLGLVLLMSDAHAAVATAEVEGPITGGAYGRPFGTSSDVDPAEFGYVEEEFFLSGDAATYAPVPGTTLGKDGLWSVVRTGTEPYRTRILVRRPVRAEDFNGTVIVLWLNTSAGFDISDWGSPHLMRRGYGQVMVSAQRQSVEGGDILGNPGTLGLKDWDPARYGSLDIARNDLAFDIFSQAARAVGPDRPDLPNDPMHGLPVQRLIATGGSQSAGWLTTYWNAVQPLEHVFDAFTILLYFGRGNPLATDVEMPDALQVRTDVPEPVMILNTENETLSYAPARQPESATFRFWEYAGLNHTGGIPGTARLDAYMLREFGFKLPTPNCDFPVDSIDSGGIGPAGLVAMDRWIRGGAAPASLPPIELTGSPVDVERDAYGNAIGGIRIPPIEVPTSTHGAPDGVRANLQCFLLGYEIPFSAEEIRGLYRNPTDYMSLVETSAKEALRAKYLLPEDAKRYRREAARDGLVDAFGCEDQVATPDGPGGGARRSLSPCRALLRRPQVPRASN